MEKVMEFYDILTPPRDISLSTKKLSLSSRKSPNSYLKKEKLELCENEDNVNISETTPENKILSTNSNTDAETDNLKNKKKRSRKKKNENVEFEEKIVVRKLTRSTNLKTFNPKYQPANQTRLEKYFKIETNPNKIGYFDTFTQSKPSNLHKCNGDFDQAAREELERRQRPGRSSCPELATVDVDENYEKEKFKKSRHYKRISPSSSKEDFSVSSFYPQRKKSSARSRKSNNSAKRSRAKVSCKSENVFVEHNSQVSEVKSGSGDHQFLGESTDSSSDFVPSKLRENIKVRKSLFIDQPAANISVKSTVNIRMRRISEEVQSSQSPVNQTRPASSKASDQTHTSNMNSNTIDLCLDVTPEKGTHITYNLRSHARLRNGEGTSASDNMNKKQIKTKKCPDYKIIEGTTFAVDAFRFGNVEGITHYFLTHFHADHYIGLKKSFDHPLYLSQITKNLVDEFIHVNEEYLHVMQLNVPVMIKDIEVTALDANHCPGAVMFLFKFPNNMCTLHTGDFRASPEMEMESAFWNNSINTIYLDTTYISSKYEFKTQHESINDVIAHMEMFKARHVGEKILYVCGSYVIGKEKVWMAMAENNKSKVWTEQNRRKAMNAINDEKMLQYLVDDPTEANIHVLAMGKVSYDNLWAYLDKYSDNFDILLAFRPSGWEKNSKPQFRGRVNIVGIEYSEHSSCREMRRFVRFHQPNKIISTVPVGNDLMQTAKIPSNWLDNSLRKQVIGFQSSITNFVKITGQCKPKNNPDYKDEMWELENAKANSSFEDVEMHDATRSISEDGSERNKLLMSIPEANAWQDNLSGRSSSSSDWMP